jgi:hypothetical protein
MEGWMDVAFSGANPALGTDRDNGTANGHQREDYTGMISGDKCRLLPFSTAIWPQESPPSSVAAQRRQRRMTRPGRLTVRTTDSSGAKPGNGTSFVTFGTRDNRVCSGVANPPAKPAKQAGLWA